MEYQVYYSSLGVPQTGLTPIWASIQNALTAATIGSPPVVTEIGGGWYKFAMTPPAPIVGVLDGGISLANADRYKPMLIPVSAATAFGSVPITLAFFDPFNSIPIPDVEVVVLNQDETLLVNSAMSNSIGQLSLQLNPGIYIVRIRKDGYNFTTPVTLTVVTAATFTYNGTSVGDIAADYRALVIPFNNNQETV